MLMRKRVQYVQIDMYDRNRKETPCTTMGFRCCGSPIINAIGERNWDAINISLQQFGNVLKVKKMTD